MAKLTEWMKVVHEEAAGSAQLQERSTSDEDTLLDSGDDGKVKVTRAQDEHQLVKLVRRSVNRLRL